VMQRCLCNFGPSIELAIGPVIPSFQRFWLQARGLVYDMPRVVDSPVACHNSSLAHHARIELRSRIRRHDMKSRRRDSMFDGPVDRTAKYIFAIIVHAENKTAVDHDP